MFFFGTNQRPAGDDYRPQVHNSDGLSVLAASGEWIWRPLVNPKRLLVSSFALTNPSGFGLMQRDRDFSQYEDLEARYEMRPSAWVEPKGQWGPGRVELVQIPVPDETNSNIVAYWVPEKLPQPKEPLDLEYRVLWQKEPDVRPPHAWVAQTRRGRGYARNPDGSIGFVVDYVGPALSKLPADVKVEAAVSVDANGELLQHSAYRNEATGGWRVTLRLRRLDDGKPVELRANLRAGNNILSETWSYLLPPG
jgi:glucans biosynthesis protein